MLDCCERSQRAFVLDIGNTSIKIACVTADAPPLRFSVLGDPRNHWTDFERWMAEELRPAGMSIGAPMIVGAPGIIEAASGTIIRYSSIDAWRNRPLAQNLRRETNAACVHLLNDGTAHTYAAIYAFQTNPIVALALGSAVACGATTSDGMLADAEIGELHLETADGDSETKIGRAYGARGLARLQQAMGNDMGAVAYGRRIARLIEYAAGRFGASVVVLSGGIMENWRREILEGIESVGTAGVTLRISPYGRGAGVVGLWAYAFKCKVHDDVRRCNSINR